jgi:hypothetical protein
MKCSTCKIIQVFWTLIMYFLNYELLKSSKLTIDHLEVRKWKRIFEKNWKIKEFFLKNDVTININNV